MGNRNAEDGITKAIGVVIFGVVVIIALVPKEVWIALGAITVGLVVIGGTAWAVSAYNKHREEAEIQAQIAREMEAAAAKRDAVAKASNAKRQRISTLGKTNAALVESALAAVKQVRASEAARAGWLGDVDFTADIREITAHFEKARALRKVTAELSALDSPNRDDRNILAEAETTIANLERTASERVELIGNCATEARLIDESIHDEREEKRTAEQRAELHGKLSAMLYGIEVAPESTPTSSAADAVMARVHAYREIKNQIQRAREL